VSKTPFLIALAAILAVLAAGILPAQDLKRPEEQLAAIYALRVQLDIEQKQLDDDMQRLIQLSAAREDARARVHRLYSDLDDLYQGKTEGSDDDLDARETEIAKAEQEVDLLTREARDLRSRIRETRGRIDLLGEQTSRLRKALPADSESLTGVWDVTYLPSGDKGAFTLRQSGTILAGEYSLEGGWQGSLQGTIVSGKVLLHRIDSRLGHSQNLEGQLSPDGHTLRGTWQNFILSGGSPTSGNWVAQKRERTES
jgi:hypothetical protein